MWRFLKKAFAMMTTFFNLSYVNSLECISMNNQECKARPKTINVNNNEAVFYPCNIKVKVWSGIKDQIKKINNGLVGEYAKDY